jgi:hypothetical protein
MIGAIGEHKGFLLTNPNIIAKITTIDHFLLGIEKTEAKGFAFGVFSLICQNVVHHQFFRIYTKYVNTPSQNRLLDW